ncbi:MAG TPA: DNA translocase FtsK 4TM domain-containing protein, partial [Burkholderiales bacterium]|nr:DNA translocase FtsK 4TM domain-containing protein [Burkholderiales bacterium]
MREARWLLLIGAGLYLLLILGTFHRSDPGWSHSATDAVVRNAGGAFGAWLSDLLLYLFGLSAYWWVALCSYLVVWGYRRMDGLRLGAALGGFFVLLAASAALERLRLHSLAAELPLAPGGLAGDAAAVALSGMLGFT